MKILMINSVCGIRSTGRICTDLADKEKKTHCFETSRYVSDKNAKTYLYFLI